MTTSSNLYQKEICYDYATRDFRATLDGQLVGYYGSYHAAEVALDAAAHDRQMHGDTHTATEPDGESEPGETAALLLEPLMEVCVQLPCGVCGHPASYRYSAGVLCTSHAAVLDSYVNDPDDKPDLDIRAAGVNWSDRVRCSYCTGSHVDDQCPLHKPTLLISQVAQKQPCGSCGGAHHIQRCPEIREALFAPESLTVRRPHKAAVVVLGLTLLWFVLLACAGDNTCTPQNDGSYVAARCVSR
jgi:hypothetical protein